MPHYPRFPTLPSGHSSGIAKQRAWRYANAIRTELLGSRSQQDYWSSDA